MILDDGNGNRLTSNETLPATTYAYPSTSNRLTSTTTSGVTTNYSYSDTGNTTSDGVYSYHYNEADRLDSVGSGPTATYAYDADGRRESKTTASGTTHYFYDPAGRLLTEMTSGVNGDIGIDYIYSEGAPIARVDWSVGSEQELVGDVVKAYKSNGNVRLDWSAYSPTSDYFVIRRKEVVELDDKSFTGSTAIEVVVGTTKTYDEPLTSPDYGFDYTVSKVAKSDALRFYHTDHLGTPIMVTSGSSVPMWRAEHFPFGGLLPDPLVDVPSNLRFPGQYADSETGLHQNWFRDYDPKTGRYREADPIGLDAGWNLFGYVDDDPVNLLDLTGLIEGSKSNRLKRQAIAAWAVAQSAAADKFRGPGPRPFSFDSYLSPQYPDPSNKCSGFTCAAAAAAQAPTMVTVPNGPSTLTRCPTAAEIRLGSIPNWRILAPSETREPGDIGAGTIPLPDVGATGHAVVIVDDGNGRTTTIGSHHLRVGPPGIDYLRNAVYRRYIGE